MNVLVICIAIVVAVTSLSRGNRILKGETYRLGLRGSTGGEKKAGSRSYDEIQSVSEEDSLEKIFGNPNISEHKDLILSKVKRLRTDLRNALVTITEKDKAEAMSQGNIWVKMSDLTSNLSSNYNQLPRHVLATHNTSALLRGFLPEPGNSSWSITLTRKAFTAAEKAANFPRDFYCSLERAMSKICHMAHLIPFSESCRKFWIPAVRYLVGLKDGYYQASYDEISYVLTGTTVTGVRTSAGASILNENWNFAYLYHQDVYLDKRPGLMWLPMVENQCTWEGAGYDVISVFDSAESCKNTGAATLADTSYVLMANNSADLAIVRKWICVFNRNMMEMVSYLSKYPGPTQEQFVNKNKICEELRMHFVSGKPLLLPSLDNVPSTAMFRVERYCSIDSKACNWHPAPHPFLLTLRGINGWLNHLHKSGLLVGLERINNSEAVILPQCLDLGHENLQCNLCLHHLSETEPGLVQEVSHFRDDFEAIWHASEAPN